MDYSKKIKTPDELMKIVGQHPRKKKVILCHGVFDIVHPGHIRHLMYAKSKAHILVAGVTSDEFVIKANYRPYVPESLRAMNLAVLQFVDYVVIDNHLTPMELIKTLQPDYYAKGYEYHADSIPGVVEVENYGGEVIYTPGDVVYSSSAIQQSNLPKIALDKLHALMEGEGITFTRLYETLQSLDSVKVHVIGDTIIDAYNYCSTTGSQVKTPTLTTRHERTDYFVGGAGIVSKHIKASGATVFFSTVLGSETNGFDAANFAIEDLLSNDIILSWQKDHSRPTTVKNIFIAENHRLLKVDRLDNRPLSMPRIKAFAEEISDTLADVVIFSDFRHGIFNKETIPVLQKAIPEKAFKAVDSQVASRWGNILEFPNFDLAMPNEREARFALGDQDSIVRSLATDLYQKLHCRTLILKLGNKGCMTIRGDDSPSYFSMDSLVEHFSDGIGAGDAFLAYAAPCLFVSQNSVIATIIGSVSAALACEQDGNKPIGKDMVINRLKKIERSIGYDNG